MRRGVDCVARVIDRRGRTEGKEEDPGVGFNNFFKNAQRCSRSISPQKWTFRKFLYSSDVPKGEFPSREGGGWMKRPRRGEKGD